MTLFWLITVALVLIAAVIFVAPMYVGKAQDDIASRDELNKAFFKDRIDELEEETSEGWSRTKMSWFLNCSSHC